MEFPLIVSYFTTDPLYSDAARSLAASLDQLSLEYHLVPIESKGSWSDNCHFKPEFLLAMMERYQRPLLWIDVDAVVVKPFSVDLFIGSEYAARILRDDGKEELLSGAVFLNNSSQAKKLLLSWKEALDYEKEKDPDIFDQKVLEKLLFSSEFRPFFRELPAGMNAIFDRDLVEGASIISYQASRMSRRLRLLWDAQ